MRATTSTFRASDGQEIFVYEWQPDAGVEPRAVVHVAHGMSEHAGRYARFAEALTSAGFVVYANDHRGHGKTARTPEDLGWFAPAGGFRRVELDLEELVGREKDAHPGLPLVLFGHSMGSYLTQLLLIERGDMLAGAVLSGTGGKPNALASAGRLVARAERMRLGERGKSALLKNLSFGAFNKAFAPARTAFDWLTRDPAEVDKYVADPLCGFDCTTSLWVDLLDGLGEIARPERQARIPKGLPIHVVAGAEDPVGERTKSIEQLLGAYERAGLGRVTHRFYPGARHEILNETNRDEVTRDLLAWLDGALGA
jgi:alpha-beta hydrolase superfamily lysophospholipase